MAARAPDDDPDLSRRYAQPSGGVPPACDERRGLQLSVLVVGRSLLARASLAAAILSLLGLLATTSMGVAVVHAESNNAPRTTATSQGDPTPHQLKAVFIVGPTNSLTQSNLADAASLADVAESLGMNVVRVFFPHATWANVLANIQGANLVVYMGHGYGWPSKYTNVLTESRQDGMGLNSYDGSGSSTYTYYGANMLRQYVHLAPNAIVFLNHLCYSAGNGEPGMAFPTPDLARQRVDNMASGWLATGAKAVFAYGEELFVKTLHSMMDTTSDPTVSDLFHIASAAHVGEYWGWVGANPQQYDSVRTPGATNFLDPDPAHDGWYRAVTGDLTMTASDWRNGPESPVAPTFKNLSASTDGAASLVGSNATLFTPNGDGSTDTVSLNYTVNKETFVDWQVQDSSDNVVRSFTSWSTAGQGMAVWDGKNDAGGYVPDGTYTLTGTPSSRAGNAGNPLSIDVQVLTTMASPATSPNLFYAGDGDNLAPTTTLSVTLTKPATLTWTIVDSNNNVVRTKMTDASVGAGKLSWTWDGKDDSNNYVAQGTYYSVTTAATDAGTYSQSVAVDARAFRLQSVVSAPFARGTNVKFTISSAESLLAKPKVRVTLPGLAAKTYSTTTVAGGGYSLTVNISASAQAGTATFHVTGTDANSVAQSTDYTFQLN